MLGYGVVISLASLSLISLGYGVVVIYMASLSFDNVRLWGSQVLASLSLIPLSYKIVKVWRR